MSKYINLDRVKEVFDYAENEFCECEYAVKNIREAVENLPAADVRPVVRGKWGDNGLPGSMLCGCSECGFTCGAHSFNFCPNCGADMREGNHG